MANANNPDNQIGSTRRDTGIDSFRYMMCFPVALLHVNTRHTGLDQQTLTAIVMNGCRIAVPFFFIASGYFMRVPQTWTASLIWQPLTRLLPVYLAWFLIYAATDAAIYGGVYNITIKTIFTGGSAYHLWFLPILSLALALSPTAIIFLGVRTTASVFFTLSLIGLAFGAYHNTLNLPAIGGIRLTMAPNLVLIGYIIKRMNIEINATSAILATITLLFLMYAEELFISNFSNTAPQSHDVVLATYPLGVAIFLLAKSFNRKQLLVFPARLGTFSLGVYASHLLFLRVLTHRMEHNTMVSAVMLAIAATLSATAFSLALARVPVARRLVR